MPSIPLPMLVLAKRGVPEPPFSAVVLLVDASKHSTAVDADWSDVVLLIDNSVPEED